MLLYGEYTIYEYETPEGYIKDAEPQTVFVEENGQLINVIFRNSPIIPETKIEQELPKTGVENSLFNSLRDILILGFLSILYMKRKYS